MPEAAPLPPATVPVAFWLLPGSADAERLQERVRRLAQEQGGPVFEPHITLHVTDCPPEIDIEAVLAQVAATSPAELQLAAESTGDSAAYYQALFVGIALDRFDGTQLLALRHRLLAAFISAHQAHERDEPASDSFQPHLSLLYGDLPPMLRKQLAAVHDFHGQTIVFDRIAAVKPAPGFSDLARVDHWKVFGHRLLGACAAEGRPRVGN